MGLLFFPGNRILVHARAVSLFLFIPTFGQLLLIILKHFQFRRLGSRLDRVAGNCNSVSDQLGVGLEKEFAEKPEIPLRVGANVVDGDVRIRENFGKRIAAVHLEGLQQPNMERVRRAIHDAAHAHRTSPREMEAAAVIRDILGGAGADAFMALSAFIRIHAIEHAVEPCSKPFDAEQH